LEINHDKAEVLKDIEYNSHTTICLEILNKWKKESKNKELQEFILSFLETVFYTNTLQRDRLIFNKIIEEYRSDKNRAIIRARESEAKVEKLEEQIEKLKKLINL